MYQSSFVGAGGAAGALAATNHRSQSSEVKPPWLRWYSRFQVTRLLVVYDAPTANSFLRDLPREGDSPSGAPAGRAPVARPKSSASAIRSRRLATDSSAYATMLWPTVIDKLAPTRVP